MYDGIGGGTVGLRSYGAGCMDNEVREVDMHQNVVKTATFMPVKTPKYQPARCVFSLGTHLLNSTYCSSVRRPSLVGGF